MADSDSKSASSKPSKWFQRNKNKISVGLGHKLSAPAPASRPPSVSPAALNTTTIKSTQNTTKPVSITAAKDRQDLWQEAFDKLPQGHKLLLVPEEEGEQHPHKSPDAVVLTVVEQTKEEYENYNNRGWHSKKGDSTGETNIRIQAKELLCSALKFKSLVDAGLMFDPTGYGTIVWAVISGGLQMLKNDKDRTEAVFDSSAFLARLLAKYAIIEAHYRDRASTNQDAIENTIIEVYLAILKYTIEVKKSFNLSLAGRAYASISSLESQAIQSLKDAVSIKDKEADEFMPLVAHQYRKKEFEQLDKKADESLGMLDEVVREFHRLEKDRILNWLSDFDYSDRHILLRNEVKKESPDSRRWFFESQEYLNWQRDGPSFLWLNGVSGCGKSSLCSTIIDSLSTTCRKDENKILAYWYFDNRASSKQDIGNFSRSLLRQIGAEADVLPEPIRKLSTAHKSRKSSPDASELRETLLSTISGLTEDVFIVLDAIDEVPLNGRSAPREHLLKVFQTLLTARLGNLHLLLSSIKEPDIQAAFGALVVARTEFEIEKPILADVDVYLKDAIEQLFTSKPWMSEDTQSKVKTTLYDPKHKRFRWATLQLEGLRGCLDNAQIEATLDGIPFDMEAAYEQKLAAIPDREVSRARNILLWLFGGLRPLSIEQLSSAPGIDLADPMYIFEIWPSSLVTLFEDTNTVGSTKAAQFAHASVKRYLSSSKVADSKNGRVRRFFMTEDAAHSKIATSCLRYLLRIDEPEQSPNFVDALPLLQYSVVHWIDHVRAIDPSSTLLYNRVKDLIMLLFNPEPTQCFRNWATLSSISEYRGARKPLEFSGAVKFSNPCPSPLYCALILELFDVVEEQLKSDFDVNALGGRLGTALQLCVRNEHSRTVQQLLEKGADVDAATENTEAAIIIALDHNQSEIIEMLLVANANVNTQSKTGGTALQKACLRGHVHIVRRLLESGAEVNAPGGIFSSALEAAAAMGHKDIVRLLLDNGADPNLTGGLLGNALQAALTGNERNRTTIVNSLLAKGAHYKPRGDALWMEAFTNIKRIMPHDMERFVQVLAAISMTTWTILERHSSIRPFRRAKYALKEHLQTVPQLSAPLIKVIEKYDTGFHGLDCDGYLARRLFWVATAISASCYLYTSTPADVEAKLRVDEMVELIGQCDEDNLFLENSDSETYRIPRQQLVELYQAAFTLLLDTFPTQSGKRWKLFGFKFIIGNVEPCRRLAAKFKESMAQARLREIPQELQLGLAKIQQEFRTQIQESEGHFLTRLTALETNISELIRDELPSIIQREVARQIQELLSNARIQAPPPQADRSDGTKDTEPDEPADGDRKEEATSSA
ncbi:hypothetical protein MMC17_008489 [Xylographa soralifera]|nr:hypothetical protein [Xylographa soralifera]